MKTNKIKRNPAHNNTSKVLKLLFLLALFTGCETKNNVEIKAKPKPQTYAINFDSIAFFNINEKYYEDTLLSLGDTIVRLVINKPFDNVVIFLFEKKDSIFFLSIKDMTKIQYNPLVYQDNIVARYFYCKKIVLKDEWNKLIKIIKINDIKNKKMHDGLNIDGGYLYLEIKTKFDHLKKRIEIPYDNNIQTLINFIENFVCE